ncbi:type IV secretory system conjugative DNA transfer family protein [Sulfitobacter geojensis]|uniref:Type IV secretory system conjugative DNA transfer family protein n=5 Tax=Sulfitobacter geojensis TaxID=1342299 RepID=A0AAE2W2H2_9RHOB|nr:type IV secretory system conjugative DNA transfer family protein [Sulfitobacter geojensis]MBM1691630.1 type IV secretory system conjugative DNA transfer family protein [Sulfitobacter geojensis]MBM1695688.1 type IV secretory system conjugative DNA transfer family protein [Sulfitobacter geojensis]MBM1707852.1 type IV secretory system conjugative DNA transfer family protein [Sulfitobacter geojensis]MBM1711914.1 type IV secretory system conjugative DNA transfer family protein [Sulfitobacter geoj
MKWADAGSYAYEEGSLFLGKSFSQSVIASSTLGKRAVKGSDFMDIGIKTERHALTIAGAGAGKGVAVIIPNLLKWPHNALVIDPKGEAAEATAEARENMGQAVHVLDPFASSKVPDRFRASYNPLDEINPDGLTVREDIETISDGIVMRGDASASHWDDGAQSVISGLIAFVISTMDEGERNLIQVRKILMDEDRLADAMQKMKTMDECAGLCRESYSAIMAKEGGYFVSNAQKNTKWLDSRGMAVALATSSFSLSDLKTEKASVFLVLPANYLGQHGRFLRLFVRCGIEAMAKKTPSGDLRQEQCLFLLDEFFSLGYIDEISKASGLMRGYGLQLWPILQDLGQLITLYGREGSETFFANADVHQFFGNTDQLTLEQISTRLGVKDMNEVPLPPPAPSGFQSGLGQGLSGMAAQSKRGSYKVTGGLIGGAISLAENAASTASQQQYQNAMNIYQRGMAEHGRPRITPDEVAQMIQKKEDVVADGMICFVFGREPLLVAPAPYFRENETPDETPETEAEPDHKNSLMTDVLLWVFLTVVMAGLFALVGMAGFMETLPLSAIISGILIALDKKYGFL